MKKITIGIIFILLLGVVSFFIVNKITSRKIYVKKLGKNRFQLIVNSKPYIIKGIVYNPVPIGKNHEYDFWSDPLKPHLHDARLMKKMGVNTIRVYEPGKDPRATKKVIKDLYEKFGIRTSMGHWISFWDGPNYAKKDFCERAKKDVIEMVKTYKNDKGILFWILGNEPNFSFSYGPQSVNVWTVEEIEKLNDPSLKRKKRAQIYYNFVNEIAKEIHK